MASLLFFPIPTPKPNSIRASSSSSSSVYTVTQSSSQVLDEKFGRKGIKFTDFDGIQSVSMNVRNGSSLSLRISDGLITSYKPLVYWKDNGFEEILHTVSSDGKHVKGGIGLILTSVSELDQEGFSVCDNDWVLKNVDSDSIDALQVELISTNKAGTLEVTYVISLFPTSMATAVIVNNKGSKPMKLTSGILTHLKFKGQNGSGVQGLRGCSYCSHPPLSSNFSILSPAEAMKPEPPGIFSFSSSDGEKPGAWTVEDQPYTVLKNKISRVYAAPPVERLKRIYNTPPSKYETIDQGTGLGFRFIRMGYEDIYLSSPGSSAKQYGNEYFVCTGPAAMLVPVVLNPGEEWRGAQVIEHDNL